MICPCDVTGVQVPAGFLIESMLVAVIAPAKVAARRECAKAVAVEAVPSVSALTFDRFVPSPVARCGTARFAAVRLAALHHCRRTCSARC